MQEKQNIKSNEVDNNIPPVTPEHRNELDNTSKTNKEDNTSKTFGPK